MCVKSTSAWIALLDEFWIYYFRIHGGPTGWDSMPSLLGLSCWEVLKGKRSRHPRSRAACEWLGAQGSPGVYSPCLPLVHRRVGRSKQG